MKSCIQLKEDFSTGASRLYVSGERLSNVCEPPGLFRSNLPNKFFMRLNNLHLKTANLQLHNFELETAHVKIAPIRS